MLESVSPSKWAPDEIRRFYRGYHKYGSDFYKVSKMVGGGKAPEMCAALWRRHQAYLSLDKKFQSEVAFLALVQDGGASHEPLPGEYNGREGLNLDGDDAYGEDPHVHHLRQQQQQINRHNGELSDAELAASRPQASLRRRNSDDDEGEDVYDDESLAAAAVVAMTSPEKLNPSDGDAGAAGGGGTLAATRARRTPKRAPASTGKRPRPATDEDIYAYYDEGSVTESARKRRQARQRLNFEGGRGGSDISLGPGPGRPPQQQQKQQGRGYTGTAEKGGIDALLALAVAETENSDEGGGGGALDVDASGSILDGAEQGRFNQGPRAIYAKGYEYRDEEPDEEDEEDVLGVLMDDDKDEDYKAGRREGGRSRRTPHSTPHKSRSRPGSAHNTPHRIVSRGYLSPGGGGGPLRSPAGGWGGVGGDMDLEGGDLILGNDDMPSYLQSPGANFLAGGGNMHHNYVASPQNPMPRLRRRKHAPEKHALLISPLKTLLGRRQAHQALGGSAAIMAIGGVAFPGQTPTDDIPANASEAELRIRHAMTVKLRKFCTYEFFYCPLDRPWYMDSTMTELVHHVGLTPGIKLTRKEWTALRASLGRPRRLSNAFLRESRTKLEIHRRTAREFYAQEQMDPAIAATLPRQVAVGQKVIARHPLTRQLHDGTVLTAGFNTYRIQFYRRDLGVEVVRDIDVMPQQPWDNLPMSLLAARPRFVMGGALIMNGRAMPGIKLPINNPVPPSAAAGGGGKGGNQMQQQSAASMQPVVTAPDPALMAEVATNLDRKEALLAQLRQMNEDASSGAQNDPATGQPNLAFTQAYTSVVMKLSEVNELLQGKLQFLERSEGGGGAAGAGLADDLARGDGMNLPPELLQAPITKYTLSAAARKEAGKVIESCKAKIEQSRRETLGELQHQRVILPFVGDAHVPTGVVAPLIEGATWTLSLLQFGADRVVPASALVSALETAILNVKPAHVVNAALYTEIEAVVNTLKQQLLASNS